MKKQTLLLFCILLSLNSIAQVDTTIGITAPKNVSKNYKALAHHLCDSLDNDYQKANAIYNWVTHNIEYDVKSVHRSKLRTAKPNTVLKRGKTICGGYSDLITAMCKEVGIRAQTIDGYYKDWKFDEGDKFFIPNHSWNALLINNKWEYIDATAGAGYASLEPNWFQRLMSKINKKKLYSANKPKFIQQYDTATFIPKIDQFSIERLSADPLWQLSDSAMPLQIFEAGEEKILAFNKKHFAPKQFDVQLSDINQLSWDEQILESAKRTYDFNPRYSSMLAHKKYVEATGKIVTAINQPNKAQGRIILNEAKKELDKTKDIQLKQRKTITKETGLLKQKNKDKTASFKKYKQELDKDNKQKNAKFRTRKKQAESAISLIAKKRSSLRKKAIPNSAQTIQGIKTMAQSKDANSPSLKKIADSVLIRTKRIQSLDRKYNQSLATIKYLEDQNRGLIEQAIDYYNESDTLLYEETKARFEMHDDYDVEVKKPKEKIQTVRLDKLNNTVDQFLESYDSLKKTFKDLIGLQTSQELNYKNNLKNIEQYKRQNDDNSKILGLYSPQVLAAQEVRQNYLGVLNDYEQSMKSHIKLFDALQKAHEHELKYTQLMSLAEKKRNELEAKKIKKDSEWLKAANKKMKGVMTQSKKEADKLFKLRHSKKKGRWEKEVKKLEERAKASKE